MNIGEFKKRKKEIEEKFGPWTAHNIQLGNGISTMDVLNADFNQFTSKASELTSKADPEKCLYMHVYEPSRWEMQSPTSSRIKRIVQIVSDICQKPWEKLRVLVYNCPNSMFAI